MDLSDIARLRLVSQNVAGHEAKTPLEVVRRLGAMQAQDFVGGKWSIGIRSPGATEQDVDRAIVEKKIARGWLMRGTLHFTAAEDFHWIRSLSGPHNIHRSKRRRAELELEPDVLLRCEKVFSKSLKGGRQIQRQTLLGLLEKEGISVAGGRGYHILFHLTNAGLLCHGAHEGAQPTFVLADEWLPRVHALERDAALVELARRYFESHGPATIQDFIWWSGLPAAEARAGHQAVSPKLTHEKIDGKTYWFPSGLRAAKSTNKAYLLSGFDEYHLGYTDRTASIDPNYNIKICTGSNGIFNCTFLIAGKTLGIWKRVNKKGAAAVEIKPFVPLGKSEKTLLAEATEAYLQYKK